MRGAVIMASHRGDIAASGFGALLFTALYAVIAGQQFTRYAYPAGMDLTIAGVVPREAVGILVDSLGPLIVAVNAILLGFHAAAGGLIGFGTIQPPMPNTTTAMRAAAVGR